MRPGPKLAAAALLGLSGAGPRAQEARDWVGLRKLCDRARDALPQGRFGLQVSVGGRLRWQRLYGGLRPDEALPIASVTKWMVAAVVLRLVDAGRLGLDDPCARWLPSFRYQHGQITLRQLLCHCSGLPELHPALFVPTLSLAQAVDALAQAPLLTLPGAEFRYGHCSYQVAGRIAELAGGKSFARLFHDELVVPLGLQHSDLEAFGRTANPILAMAGRSTLDDCRRFVEVLAGHEDDAARPFLSARMRAEMFRDQVGSLPRAAHPFPDGRPYGLGVFLERVDGAGRALRVGHPGLLGWAPWIDFDRDLTGVFGIRDDLLRDMPWVEAMQAWLEQEVQPPGVTLLGRSSPSCRGPLRLSLSGTPRAGVPGQVLRCAQAPPGAFGLLVMGAAGSPTGLDLLGSRIHVSPKPVFLQVVVASDAAGRHVMPLPLERFPVHARFALQYVWDQTEGCPTPSPFATSPAILLDLR